MSVRHLEITDRQSCFRPGPCALINPISLITPHALSHALIQPPIKSYGFYTMYNQTGRRLCVGAKARNSNRRLSFITLEHKHYSPTCFLVARFDDLKRFLLMHSKRTRHSPLCTHAKMRKFTYDTTLILSLARSADTPHLYLVFKHTCVQLVAKLNATLAFTCIHKSHRYRYRHAPFNLRSPNRLVTPPVHRWQHQSKFNYFL